MTNIPKKNSDKWEDFDHNIKLFIKRKKQEKLTGKEINKFCDGSCMEKGNYKICGKGCKNKINLEKNYFYKKLDTILLEIY